MHRCMGDDKMMSEFPKQDQRVAVCMGSWGKKHPEAKKHPAAKKHPIDKAKDEGLRTRTQLVKLETNKDLVRTETLDGRTYTVAPVIALREGVHNQEFISYEEITVFVDAWAGRPLPIDHPTDANGAAITANSPKVIESSVVGSLFNVTAKEDIRALAGEIWVDVVKAETVVGGAEVLRKLNAGENLEVSTAYYTFIDNVPGEWMNPNGTIEKFTGSQSNIRPDHLALLPFDLGACSWEDGCGAPRLNADDRTGDHTNDHTNDHTDDHTLSSVKDTISETIGQSMPDSKNKSLQTDNEKLQINGKQLGRALKGMLAAHAGEDGTSSLMIDRLATACNIDKSKVVALVNGELDFAPKTWLTIFAAVLDVDAWDLFMSASNDNSDARYAENKKTETASSAQNVTVTVTIPDNTKSESKVETVVAENVNPNSENKSTPCGCSKATISTKIKEIVTNALKSFGIEEGTELEKTMNKKERVDALIASDKTQFSENHREWLTSLSDDQLEVLGPKAEPKAEIKTETAADTKTETKTETKSAAVANTEVKSETKTEQKAEVKAETPAITKDQILAALGVSAESIEAIRVDAETKKAARANKIKEIAAIEGCVYTEAELATFNDAMLDRTLQALQPDIPFRFNGSIMRTASEEIPPTPSFFAELKAKGGK